MAPTSDKSFIVVRGARQHNLKHIDLDIPRNRLVVVTGPSGSGKSSLVFDTIYAEGQRRYVESLSTYARQFLNLMEKPDADRIDGLSPAVAIEQRGSVRTPRSTVGTITEIYDYLRLLFARAGQPHCPRCERPITRHTVQNIVDTVLAFPERQRIQILAPLVRNEKGTHLGVFERLRKEGYVRVRIDGHTHPLDADITPDRRKTHTIEAVVDRLVTGSHIARRLADSLETALGLSGGTVTLDVPDAHEQTFSTSFACAECGIGFEDLTPQFFSFNSPYGACPDCSGMGTRLEIDPDKIVPDPSRSISEGAVAPWGAPKGEAMARNLQRLARQHQFDLSAPFSAIPEAGRQAILWGGKGGKPAFEGVIPVLQRRYRDAQTDDARAQIEPFMRTRTCPACGGARLRPEALSVKVAARNIAEITTWSISVARRFFEDLELPHSHAEIVNPILKEIRNRLSFLQDVGVDYLSLNRSAMTLSGGEIQRIRLATQIGSRLVGVLYVLDEPSIGLHPRDNRRLIHTLCQLRDMGNSVLVVEHDRDMMMAADHLIDLGPGAGEQGGQIIAQGPPEDILGDRTSLTGDYLSGRKRIPPPPEPRIPRGRLILRGARGHNLRSVDLSIPLGAFVCITGVSGSGKSTLINQTLHPALAGQLHGASEEPLPHDGIEGLEQIDKVIRIDQAPIGRTPRSNPATYTGLFTDIRALYAQLPEARVRGYTPGRFSFNLKGGRCEVCQGDGVTRIEMHFLPDVYVTCEACGGKRYNRETLEIRYKGFSIADALDMTVYRAVTFFRDIPQMQRKLRTLSDVGLGYIRLGQPATALSGGEAQRVKLSAELSRIGTGKTLYILDEPTTGLHFEDIRILTVVLDRLVDKGNTVVVIEHNLDVIKRADWVIDLGPEGGDRGGAIVTEGTPQQVARIPSSYTGQFLSEVLPS